MCFRKKLQIKNAKIFNCCTKTLCSRSWNTKKLKETRSSTTQFKWETSSKRSKNSIFRKIWKREEKWEWAVSEEDRRQVPILHRLQVKDKGEKNTEKISISTNTNIEDKGVNLRKGRGRESSRKRHTNNQNCLKIISKIGSEVSPNKIKTVIWNQITPCTKRNTKLKFNLTRKTEESGLKRWEKMLKNYKLCGKAPENVQNQKNNREITRAVLPKSEERCWTSSKKIVTTVVTKVQMKTDSVLFDND